MRSQEARDYIQSLKHLDPQVVRKADLLPAHGGSGHHRRARWLDPPGVEALGG